MTGECFTKCGNFDMKCTFIYTGGKRLCKTCGAAKNLYTIHRGYQQAVDNPCAKEYPGAREARERLRRLIGMGLAMSAIKRHIDRQAAKNPGK